MSSSISSSDPAAGAERAWRRFWLAMAGTAAGTLALLFAFVAIIDPFDTLPLSPPFDRVPVASNARYAHPALARSAAFDSAVIGTSTSRLLRPSVLDAAFGGARFVNLAMNAATAWEQLQLLRVFLRAHPAPREILVGLDVAWCEAGAAGAPYGRAVTERAFPDWMYATNRWAGYRHLLNLDALEQSARLFGVLIGVKRPVYGRDGYTSFVPPDAAYDPARAAAHLAQAAVYMPPGPQAPAADGWHFPALAALARELAPLPAGSRVLLFFVPYYVGIQPQPDTPQQAQWQACKQAAARIVAARAGWQAVDFMRPTALTRAPTNYWDPLHTRQPVADRVAEELAQAQAGRPVADAATLGAPPAPAPTAEE